MDPVVKPALKSSSSPVAKSPGPGELKQNKQYYSFCLFLLSLIIFFPPLHIRPDFGWICNTVRRKARRSSPSVKQEEEGKRLTDKGNSQVDESTLDSCPLTISSPVSLQISRSPSKGEQKHL